MAFCDRFKYNKKDNLEFRISITHLEESRYLFNKFGRYYWEPKAPSSSQRCLTLSILPDFFKCSVSLEPLLDSEILKCFVKNRRKYFEFDIWVGCLTNYKLNPDIPEEKQVIEFYKKLPEIYEEYKQYNFIKWKDSFFKAMNREIKRRKIGGSK